MVWVGVFTLLSARYTMTIIGRTRAYPTGSTDPTDPNVKRAPDLGLDIQARRSRAPTSLANWVTIPYLVWQSISAFRIYPPHAEAKSVSISVLGAGDSNPFLRVGSST